MIVAQYLTKQLAAWGVKRIYGVAGDGIFAWLDALGKQTEIQYISCRHEAAAAMMASAEAKLTGKPGVCTATMGPGFVNLLNGLADAHTDRAPVIAITGQVETRKLGGTYKQFVAQEDMIRPISVYQATVSHPDAVGEVLHRAFVSAAQQKGVAHLAICKDVFAQKTKAGVLPQMPRIPRVLGDRMEIESAAEQIMRAKAPLILMGTGARPAAAMCLRLAEQLGAGILLSLGAKGAIDESHRLVLGGLGEGGSEAALQALEKADLLVILGASWFPQEFIPKQLPIIQVDHAAASMHAHARLLPVTADLLDVLPLWSQRLKAQTPGDAWEKSVESWHARFLAEPAKSSQSQSLEEAVRPEVLMHTLGQAVADDAIVVLDTGEHTIWFNRVFRASRQWPLFSGKWRTMGFALPAAISAKLAFPDRQVVCVTGDGGLQMSLAELMTAAEHQAAITIVVVNNRTLGLEELKMKQEGFQPFGVHLHNPDFALWAKACGADSHVVRAESALEPVLRQALTGNRLTLLDIHCTAPTLIERKKQIPFQAQA
ncbi:thiamine pyrophosphate-binding protein [Brevibacillus gelatini]|uniref:Thiamine pyrophosphate-binding protein n=1 Tax=Brevibacillus gelatini TaxID=1655277 RepID=A0A3M8B5D5_9BACL|nr:thiamine pyrophosphate-binding protein [Brevibacillus gelatini]RNB58473.1 thiamine pyrophosphate-binding protein [Brevibacillus gelatini]